MSHLKSLQKMQKSKVLERVNLAIPANERKQPLTSICTGILKWRYVYVDELFNTDSERLTREVWLGRLQLVVFHFLLEVIVAPRPSKIFAAKRSRTSFLKHRKQTLKPLRYADHSKLWNTPKIEMEDNKKNIAIKGSVGSAERQSFFDVVIERETDS